jgi:hypothetical protein
LERIGQLQWFMKPNTVLLKSIRQGVWRVTQSSNSSIRQGSLSCVTSPKISSTRKNIPEAVVNAVTQWNNSGKTWAIYFNISVSDVEKCFFSRWTYFERRYLWGLKPKTLKMDSKLSGKCPEIRKIVPSIPWTEIWTYRDEKYIRQEPRWRVTRLQNSSRQAPPWRVTDELILIVQ